MTIILCTRARKAALAKGSDPAKLARPALAARGLVVSAKVLAGRSLSECIDALNWASRRKPVAVRPPFLAELLAEGKARQLSGVCQECGCTDAAGCFPGCAWANAAATLCTSCLPGRPRRRR